MTDAIDDVLYDWYIWSQGYNPGTDYAGFDSTCAHFRTSRQWMDYEELDQEVEWNRKKYIGQLVEPMVNKLDLPARMAVNTAMLNMSVGANVWSSGRHTQDDYVRAKALLCPKLVSAGLVEKSTCKLAELV